MSKTSILEVTGWSDETDARPAPMVLAIACGITLALAVSTPIKTLYGFSAVFALFSIQVSIWRAAKMIVTQLSKMNSRG